MTEKMPPLVNEFLQAWNNAFIKIVTQLGAANVSIAEVDRAQIDPTSGDEEKAVHANFIGGGSLKGQLTWSCAKATALQCAQLLMSEPVDPAAEFNAAHLDGFQEFMRQVAGEVAVAWKDRTGAPTEINCRSEYSADFTSVQDVAVSLDSDKCKGLRLRGEIDAGFLSSLTTLATPANAETAASAEDSAASPVHGIPSNLELILDVQLEATIRFGEREMLLRDVFGLMPGAVVELNQLVNEPADLLVAGRLIARGEVVVVDGNFGLRVSEVVSPAQRAAVLCL